MDFIHTIQIAADPGRALASVWINDQPPAKAHILAFGKGSIPMTHAAIELLGDRFARASVIAPEQLILQSQFKSRFVDLLVGDHPLPTRRSVESTAQLIEHARSIPNDHQAIVLISGGSSAMLCKPNPVVSLDDIIELTETMLRAGESIHAINAARSKLDSIKSGGLAILIAHTHHPRAYVLSDVIGDDLEIIGSGPAYDTQHPIPHTIIANNRLACDAAIAFATQKQIHLVKVIHDAIGSPSEEATRMIELLMRDESQLPAAVCLGGEPTTDASGASGVGGPMTELALCAAIQLAGAPFRWTVITYATDGIDGPTDAAGAIITSAMFTDPKTLANARLAIENHDALTMCDRIGASIRTGCTGTNINDMAIAIRWD